jgi:LCP family protein required for cell wall assembly
MRPRRGWGQRFVLLFNSLVIIAALSAAGLIWLTNQTLATTRRVPIHASLPASTTSTTTVPARASSSAAPQSTETTLDLSGDVKAQNFLLVGSDSRACIDPNSPYAGAFLTDGTDIGDRSDTIMLLRIDPDQSQAAILSFPRDLWVRIGGTNRKDRINSAFEKDNPSRLVQTIEQDFDVPVDHYIEVDFCAFKYLVDTLGGVKIPFAYPTRDRNTGLNFTAPGCYTLSGDAALAYVRSRHYQYEVNGRWKEDGSSDRGRIRRQQDFIKRTLQKAIERGASRPDVAKKLIDTALKYVRIDSTLTVNDLLRVATRLRSFDPSGVRTYRIDGRGATIGGSSVILPELNSKATQDVLKLFRGQARLADAPPVPAGPSASTAAGTTSTTSPSTTSATGGATTPDDGSTVQIVDNGVGIFPPNDPSCR